MMKPYMAYSYHPDEGAILVFASSVKEAKKIGWKESYLLQEICGNDYMDLSIRLLRDDQGFLLSLADQEKLKKNIPHMIENPPLCQECELWGSELNEEGFCDDCINAIAEGGSWRGEE